MHKFVRFILLASLVLIVTGATNLVYLVTTATGIGGVLALLIAAGAYILGVIFLKQQGNPIANRHAGIEVLLSMALLYFPVFMANYWIHFTVSPVSSFGIVQIMVVITAVLSFQLMLYLDENGVRRALQVGLVIYVLSIIYDLYANGLILALARERPGGFLVNANDGADITVALLLVSLPWERRSASGYWLILISFVGVLLTLSRSGLLLWFLVAAAFAWSALTRGRALARWLTITMGVVALGGFIAFIQAPTIIAEQLGVSSGNLERIQSIAELAQGNTSSANDSGRGTLFENWTRKISDTPVWGSGTNFTVSDLGPMYALKHLGPHNMYLARLGDSGIIGAGTFLAFIVFWLAFFLARRHSMGLILTGVFIVASVFSHNTADSRPLLALFGMLAADATRKAQFSRWSLPGLRAAPLPAPAETPG